MKQILSIILLLAASAAQAQSALLSKTEAGNIFTDSVKNAFGIKYNLYRVYKYSDKQGTYLAALTEKTDSIVPGGDTLHYNIKALGFTYNNGRLQKTWELNDLVRGQSSEHDAERSIWFWTKYCVFADIDGDKLADPVLVYGTHGQNGYDDGRIKIVVFYKGKKATIRHQNGVLDYDRNTQVDAAFYVLPPAIQKKVKEQMQKMTENGHAIFPYGWQDAMKKKKLTFDENH